MSFAKNLEIYEDRKEGPKEFVAQDSGFRCELPREALGYTALAPCHLRGSWGSAGYNTAGVGMSATESIFSSEKALAVDPLVKDGLAENSVFNIVLPYIRTAREGVSRLGSLIEQYGISSGMRQASQRWPEAVSRYHISLSSTKPMPKPSEMPYCSIRLPKRLTPSRAVRM